MYILTARHYETDVFFVPLKRAFKYKTIKSGNKIEHLKGKINIRKYGQRNLW